MKGREVSVPQDVKRIAVVPIPWASVIYAIDGSSERLAAIHGGAMSAYKGKFLETKDKHFAQLDTKIIAQNFLLILKVQPRPVLILLFCGNIRIRMLKS